jgi:hypothetical protein
VPATGLVTVRELDHAPGRVVLDQLELGQSIIACAQQLTGRPVVGPVLEPEAVGLAASRAEERDQLIDLRLLLEPARDIPAGARLRPVDVALLVAAPGRHDRGRELRPARRPIGDVVRKPHLVEAGHRATDIRFKQSRPVGHEDLRPRTAQARATR